MDCPTCGMAYAVEDNFCRQCGASLPGNRLPVMIQGPVLPVPWREVRRSLVRVTAGLVVGTALELVRRQVQRYASPQALADRIERLVARRRIPPAIRPQRSTPARGPVRVVSGEGVASDAGEGGTEVTVVRSYFFQRIWLRR